MSALDSIRARVTDLYKTNPKVHITITLSHPRLSFNNDPVTIVGVYPNLFRIEEYSSGRPEYHTLQYADLHTGYVKIAEL